MIHEFARSQHPILVAENLIKIYTGSSGNFEVQALRGVSFEVYENEKLFLVGPSGSGKTTLVNIIAGIIKPTSGTVLWGKENIDITRLSYDEIIKKRRTFASIIFQDTKLIKHYTVQENVLLAGFYAGLQYNQLIERTEKLLKTLGLWEKRKKKEDSLSGGEKKRAAIAAALVTSPKIIIADEPTGDLDLATSNAILDLLDEVNENMGVAILLVTHSQNVASRADRLLELQDGVIIAQHNKAKLRELDKSRYLELDRQSRIKLPKEILSKVGNPKHFIAMIEGGRIILIPKEAEKKRRH